MTLTSTKSRSAVLIGATCTALKREEGFRPTPYLCTEGVWTIGYGFTTLTEPESSLVLRLRVRSINASLAKFEWYAGLNDTRKSVLIQMAYQLGICGVLKFRRMISALEGGFYAAAADEMERSHWKEQTPGRVIRLAELMRVGA